MVVVLAGCGSEVARSASPTAVPTGPPVTPFAGSPAEAMALRFEEDVTVRVEKIERVDDGEPPVGISVNGDRAVVIDTGGYDEERTKGVVRLGEHGQSNHMGVIASDLTTSYHRTDISEEQRALVDEDLSDRTTQTITIAGGVGESDEYVRRATRGDLPAGKSWYRDERDYGCGLKSELGTFTIGEMVQVDVLEKMAGSAPVRGEVLDGVDTTLYAGSSSISELGSTSSFTDAAQMDILEMQGTEVVVSWQLWVGPDQLPRRIRITTPIPPSFESDKPTTAVTEVSFSGWGAAVTISPPPGDQVHVMTGGDRGCIEMGE
ncbi:hypothetical protein HII36_15940 [Nonomuraea sp. NN258]|uniref:hypothetical protein n=1 Tax=Nonomuraea antri TaxID=2730852 RepID=UPI001567E975|nr:hypothetical protein [Nonomuraea antri]NRQ33327.1 hypothetical protein [Nonomuraea antri]